MDTTLRKKMIVCTPFGKFVNGEQHGVMDVKRLKALAANFRKHPRPVPVYAMGDHVEALDERIPDGWVEGLTVDAEGRLVADVKLEGDAASLVLGDKIRLASIATVQGKNPDGTAQGEVLQHVLLTNDAFDKQANIQIAAALAKGAELHAYFSTALKEKKEVGMADQVKDDMITSLRDEIAALKAATPDERIAAQLKETQLLLQEKSREVAELTASNENLKVDVERFKSPEAIEELQTQLKAEQRKNRAAEIRRKVAEGVSEGQFSVALVGYPKSGYNHPSDEMVLSWFKSSAFKNSTERLDIMMETMPKKAIGRTFTSGDGTAPDSLTLNEDERDGVAQLGLTPEKVVAGLKAKDYKSYVAATARKG